jgi:Rad3-related DNA helicases
VDAAELLGPDGPFAGQIPGFAPRPAQQQMAKAVAAVLDDGGTLIVEAGTGTGKTYAYLAPALLSGARVIISTGTRHLQDQLYHQDLPVVRRALRVPARVALLKGARQLSVPISPAGHRGKRAADLARAGRRAAPHPGLGNPHPPRRHRRNLRRAGNLADLATGDLDRGQLSGTELPEPR